MKEQLEGATTVAVANRKTTVLQLLIVTPAEVSFGKPITTKHQQI